MVELAIPIVRLEQAIERQKSRKQRRHPDNTRADTLQERRLGTNTERKQYHSEDKESEDKSSIASLAQREAQIAPEESDERRHAQLAAGQPVGEVNASSVIVAASAISIA